jgi:hypothetical protein
VFRLSGLLPGAPVFHRAAELLCRGQHAEFLINPPCR